MDIFPRIDFYIHIHVVERFIQYSANPEILVQISFDKNNYKTGNYNLSTACNTTIISRYLEYLPKLSNLSSVNHTLMAVWPIDTEY